MKEIFIILTNHSLRHLFNARPRNIFSRNTKFIHIDGRAINLDKLNQTTHTI